MESEHSHTSQQRRLDAAARYPNSLSTELPLTEDATPLQTTRQEPRPQSPTQLHTDPNEPNIERPERVSSATPLWKTQTSNSNKQHLKRVRLTRKNLALFNKMTKKGTNKAAPSASLESAIRSTTKTTSTTMSDFAIKAVENGILLPCQSKPPTNLDEICKRYTQSRQTPSPTESSFKTYIQTLPRVGNEATTVLEVGTMLLKKYPEEHYARNFSRTFTGLPKDVGFNNSLSAPQPDFVEGLGVDAYTPFFVYKHIDGAVLFKDDPLSITLPHIAGEWKGRGKDLEEAALQCSYDGAALVYARNQALSYLGKSDPPGHSEITTFATDGTTLNFFAHYAAPAEDGTVAYHQHLYATANLNVTYQGHKDGRKGLRNAQDHARDQSYALRDQLKEHWKQHRSRAVDGTLEETNADKDEAGYEIVTPASSSQKHRASSSMPSSESLPSVNHDNNPSSNGRKRRASSLSHTPGKKRKV